MDDQQFHIMLAPGCDGCLKDLIHELARAKLIQTRPTDPYSSPLIVGFPFRPLKVDWWETDLTGARDLKVWAGTMESFGIAQALQHALQDKQFESPHLFDVGMVVTLPQDPRIKKEPYYFDSRRAPNAHARDIGFAPNDLKMTSIAHPAVELLCLIGLQVARPTFTVQPRVYDYYSWHIPLMTNLLLAASTGMLAPTPKRVYRFENWFRTGQRKHKAFRAAMPLTQGV